MRTTTIEAPSQQHNNNDDDEKNPTLSHKQFIVSSIQFIVSSKEEAKKKKMTPTKCEGDDPSCRPEQSTGGRVEKGGRGIFRGGGRGHGGGRGGGRGSGKNSKKAKAINGVVDVDETVNVWYWLDTERIGGKNVRRIKLPPRTAIMADLNDTINAAHESHLGDDAQNLRMFPHGLECTEENEISGDSLVPDWTTFGEPLFAETKSKFLDDADSAIFGINLGIGWEKITGRTTIDSGPVPRRLRPVLRLVEQAPLSNNGCRNKACEECPSVSLLQRTQHAVAPTRSETSKQRTKSFAPS